MQAVKKLMGIIVFIVCVPLIGSILIKSDRQNWKRITYDISVMDESFKIAVKEENGTFYYKPETLTGLLMYRVIPEDIEFSCSEDFIVRIDNAQDPEQEYLKALAIVCRSCIAFAWETEQCPEVLDYGRMQFGASDFYKIIQTDAAYRKVLSDNNILLGNKTHIKLNEIERAVDATKGAVITRDGKVIAAPFFTTAPSDMLVGDGSRGVGFSLNYAYDLATEGVNFYGLLRYFYEDFRVTIYEEIHK